MKIERRRGDTSPDVCTVSLASTFKPANITGCTFTLTISTVQYPADSSTVLYTVAGNITDATNGTVEFSPSAVQADKTGYYFYEVKMTDSYSKVHTLAADTYQYK